MASLTHAGGYVLSDELVSANDNAADALFTAVLENSVQLVPPENPRHDILAGGIRITPPSRRADDR
ncbi:hypothetical protein FACS1894101_1750 [Betaproteobacteria bacterium]|nr:hypothetical protein FACS1894101_1750 [Betaproteobacteria bacterium]